VFSTACESALITSIASKWRPFSFIFNQGNREKSQGAKSGEWEMTVILFLFKNSMVERKCEKVCYREETVNSFVAKFQVKVFAHFHAVAVKHHSSMWN
jgi:hypothetical protein